MQSNALTTIKNLDGLSSLVQLDLSENNIHYIEGLSHLPNLTTLNLSKNALVDAASISHLKDCNELTAVDMSKNQLNGKDILDCFAGIAKLTSLNLAGNPVVSKVAYFRKKMIVCCKTLRYLDRPIFDNERAVAEVWQSGGIEAEKELKDKLRQEKKDEERRKIEEFRAWKDTLRHHEVVPKYEVDGVGASEFSESMSTNTNSCSVRFIDEDEDLLQTPEAEERPLNGAPTEVPTTEPAVFSVVDDAKVDANPILPSIELITEDKTVKRVSFKEPSIEPIVQEVSTVPQVVVEPKYTALESKNNVPLIDINKENIEPPSTTPTYSSQDEEMAVEMRARLLCDSMTILKSGKNQSLSGITGGWTSDIELRLKQLAGENNYDFGAVASKLEDEFGSSGFIVFDEDSCYRRHTLLDMSSGVVVNGIQDTENP